MGKITIGIVCIDGNVKMQSNFENANNIDLSVTTLNLDKISNDIKTCFFNNINKTFTKNG